MVEIHIADESTATVGGVEVTGPAHLFGETCTVGGSSYTSGYVIVNAGASTKTLPFTAAQTQSIPLILCVAFVLGLLWSRFGLVR